MWPVILIPESTVYIPELAYRIPVKRAGHVVDVMTEGGGISGGPVTYPLLADRILTVAVLRASVVCNVCIVAKRCVSSKNCMKNKIGMA